MIRGVSVGPSPLWLANRLRAVGARPVNNVVDATNYAMLELGQPLHAFDLAKLEGSAVVVGKARPGESLVTLDGENRALSPEMLTIRDAARPMAVAGVMGGAASEVSTETADVLLECALFEPRQVRAARRALGMSTDASYRFERGVDPETMETAVHRAASLIAAVAGGALRGQVIDACPSPWKPPVVETPPISRAPGPGGRLPAGRDRRPADAFGLRHGRRGRGGHLGPGGRRAGRPGDRGRRSGRPRDRRRRSRRPDDRRRRSGGRGGGRDAPLPRAGPQKLGHASRDRPDRGSCPHPRLRRLPRDPGSLSTRHGPRPPPLSSGGRAAGGARRRRDQRGPDPGPLSRGPRRRDRAQPRLGSGEPTAPGPALRPATPRGAQHGPGNGRRAALRAGNSVRPARASTGGRTRLHHRRRRRQCRLRRRRRRQSPTPARRLLPPPPGRRPGPRSCLRAAGRRSTGRATESASGCTTRPACWR